jgi:HTH-type transcriptional regulator, competence development regulator
LVNLATFICLVLLTRPENMDEQLGGVLRLRREELGLSLRQVEDKTGISNAYLSQVENHKIAQPSPSILRKLADLYEISYSRLMGLAGHPAVDDRGRKAVFFRTSSGLKEITRGEERELLDYLRFLRMKRSEK